jgi:hypothetical protein
MRLRVDVALTTERCDHSILRDRGYHNVENKKSRRMGDGVKHRARLHRPQCRSHSPRLVSLWLPHALGRPTAENPAYGDMMAQRSPLLVCKR